MAGWQKLIRSGSAAELSSIKVAGIVSASTFSGSHVGDGSGLTGIVATAAPAGPNQSVQFNDNGATSGSANFRFEKSTNIVFVTGSVIATSVTSSLFGTASFAISASWAPGGQSATASYALTASYFDNSQIANFTQASLASTWSFTHNLNNETPLVTVWNADKEIVIPEKIKSTGLNSIQIFFPVSLSGYASAVNGIIPSNSSIALSSSYAISSSYASIVPVQNTASYSLTSSFNNSIFTRGGTIVDLVNGISTTGSYIVWRSPYTCRLTSLYGRANGSTTAQINASRSGSAGRLYHTASNLVLSSADNWMFTNSVQNTDYSAGDTLEIIITGSSAKQVAVQLEFIRI